MQAGIRITGLVLVLLLSGWAAMCFGEAVQSGIGKETSIIMVRHAERTEFTQQQQSFRVQQEKWVWFYTLRTVAFQADPVRSAGLIA